MKNLNKYLKGISVAVLAMFVLSSCSNITPSDSTYRTNNNRVYVYDNYPYYGSMYNDPFMYDPFFRMNNRMMRPHRVIIRHTPAPTKEVAPARRGNTTPREARPTKRSSEQITTRPSTNRAVR